MTYKVTYTDRNNNEHNVVVNSTQLEQLMKSLVWTNGEIKRIEKD